MITMNNLNYTLNFELNPVIETLEAQTRAAAAAEGRLALGLAGRADICEALKKILGVFFPNRYLEEKIENDEMNIYIGDNLRQAARLLQKHIADALCLKESGDCACSREKADEIVRKLLFSLPQIRQDLMEDVNTGYHGDPAALNLSEVILSYPFVETVAVYRVAHNLYSQGVPIIPRIMSEYAHSQSGIDIHPGAEIQPGFFIDHGTGVVIGETCRIGRNVILYQGVTPISKMMLSFTPTQRFWAGTRSSEKDRLSAETAGLPNRYRRTRLFITAPDNNRHEKMRN